MKKLEYKIIKLILEKKLKSLPIKIIILFYGLKIMIMYNGIITLLLKQAPIV